MLTTPTTVTIAGTGHSLIRIREDNFVSLYRKKDVNLQIDLTIRHSLTGDAKSKNRTERHNVELVHTAWDVNGVPTVTKFYVVMEMPQSAGATQVVAMVAGLSTWLTASTNAYATSIANWDS